MPSQTYSSSQSGVHGVNLVESVPTGSTPLITHEIFEEIINLLRSEGVLTATPVVVQHTDVPESFSV